MSTALRTVQQIHAAFSRGDIPGIVELLDDDAQWETWAHNSARAADVPWLRAGTGQAAALRLFEEIGRWTFKEFQVLEVNAAGKVTRFRHYVVTAKHIAAAR